MSDTFTLAPDVTVLCTHWGFVVEANSVEAVLACGIVEPEWLEDGKTRLANGKTKRSREFLVGGQPIKTTVTARGKVEVWISHLSRDQALRRATEAERLREGYDGARKSTWAKCAWQPDENAQENYAAKMGLVDHAAMMRWVEAQPDSFKEAIWRAAHDSTAQLFRKRRRRKA